MIPPFFLSKVKSLLDIVIFYWCQLYAHTLTQVNVKMQYYKC